MVGNREIKKALHGLLSMFFPLNRSSIIILTLSLAIFLVRFIGINVSNPYNNDEFAYYCAAQRLAEGERPYEDFLFVHPPGLVFMTAIGIRAGLPLPSQRVVHALSGLILGGIVYLTTRRIHDRGQHAPALAVLFLFSSPLFFTFSRQILTDLPATILVSIAVLVVILGWRGHVAFSAALLVAGSAFRLQSLIVVPCILLLIAIAEGVKAVIVSGTRFILCVMLFTVLFHGAMQLTWPQYFEDVVTLHRFRPRIGLYDRYHVLDSVSSNITFALGLLSSAIMLSRPSPLSRGFGGLTLLAVPLTAVAFNSIYDHYFLIILPYLCICSSILICDIALLYARGSRPCWQQPS